MLFMPENRVPILVDAVSPVLTSFLNVENP